MLGGLAVHAMAHDFENAGEVGRVYHVHDFGGQAPGFDRIVPNRFYVTVGRLRVEFDEAVHERRVERFLAAADKDLEILEMVVDVVDHFGDAVVGE